MGTSRALVGDLSTIVAMLTGNPRTTLNHQSVADQLIFVTMNMLSRNCGQIITNRSLIDRLPISHGSPIAPQLGHERMVWAVCLSIFLRICDMAGLLRGTFVSWWFLPRIWPSVTDMQHYYHARYPTDDWHLAHMFLLVYFSVEVCREGVFPHSVSTMRDPCARVYESLTLPPPPPPPPREKTKSKRGDPAIHLHQAKGQLNRRMGLPALLGGNLGCWIV